MKAGKIFLWFFVGLICLSLTSCKNDNKDDFSGVSDLISNRNKARYTAADRAAQEKNHTSKQEAANKFNAVQSESKSKREELSAIILYKENVKILGSKSGKTLAKGVAYINKQGEIVKIKILNN